MATFAEIRKWTNLVQDAVKKLDIKSLNAQAKMKICDETDLDPWQVQAVLDNADDGDINDWMYGKEVSAKIAKEIVKIAKDLISAYAYYYVEFDVVDPKKGWEEKRSNEYPKFDDEMMKLDKKRLVHSGMGGKHTYTWEFDDESEAKEFANKLAKHPFIKKWGIKVKIL